MQVVGAIIRNRNVEFLLQQRNGQAPSFQYCWTLFGGAVEPNESPERALIRELQEEIGLQPSQIDSLTLVEENTQQNGTQQIIYEVLTKVPLNQLVLREGEAMEYCPIDTLLDHEFAFNIKDVLIRYLAKNHVG